MSMRIALFLSALAAPAMAAQQSAPPSVAAPAEAPRDDLVQVALETEKGRIVLALDRGRAPVTTANFLRYVDAKRFDGISFYRAMPWGGAGLIQAGITKDARKLFPPIAHEPTDQTGLRHETGAIAMANVGPGTARSDFFILGGPIPALDRDFAVFGRVVEGLDVVKAILTSPVDPMKGNGAMQGQMLEPEVRILTAKRLSD